jgi:hypothetical protein
VAESCTGGLQNICQEDCRIYDRRTEEYLKRFAEHSQEDGRILYSYLTGGWQCLVQEDCRIFEKRIAEYFTGRGHNLVGYLTGGGQDLVQEDCRILDRRRQNFGSDNFSLDRRMAGHWTGAQYIKGWHKFKQDNYPMENGRIFKSSKKRILERRVTKYWTGGWHSIG